MNKIIGSTIAIIIVAGSAAYYFYFQKAEEAEPAPPPLPAVVLEIPEPQTEPAIDPIVREEPAPEPEPEAEPLPPLMDSDPVIAATISGVVGSSAFDQLFNVQEIVQHIVATVDNLPRKKLSQKIIPVKAVVGDFGVEGETDSLKVSAGNYSRYAPYVSMIAAANTGEVVDSYRRFYPLFQEAYQQLGYPDGDFNDRMLAVVDHLLATPDVTEPVYLIKPEAFYVFEDPDLEALSAGQKTLIRMGNTNAATIKSKLQEFRYAVSM